MSPTRFVVMKHEAERAGLHYDLRFRIPGSNMWASFAVRKGIPLEQGVKVLAVRTEDHTEKGALITGTIGSGYGKGKLTKWDGGYCDVEKYTTSHIILNFRGNKIKGIYHLLNTKYVLTKVSDSKEGQSYMLFKGKVVQENYENDNAGMNSRVPPNMTSEEEMSDEEADEQQSKPLPWSMGGNNVVNKISIQEIKNVVEVEEVKLLIDQEEQGAIQKSIMDFFKNNPSPDDEEIHALADKLKIDPHEFESKIYSVIGSFFGAGKAKDFKGDYDPEQIKMGIEVEKEHTTDPAIAERIAKDHLAEIPDYYTRLKKMESEAGIKD